MNLATSRVLGLLALTSFVVACGSDTVGGSDGEVETLEVDTLEVDTLEADEVDVAPDIAEVEAIEATEVVIVAPSFVNLPGAVDTEVGAAGTFVVGVTPADAELSAVHDCTFEVALSVGTLAWTCPLVSSTCEATVSASAAGLVSNAVLVIRCANGVPRFEGDAPVAALEGERYAHAITCVDPEGLEVTLEVGVDDDCGGSIEDDSYVFVPDESDGGSTCTAHVTCSDGELDASQALTIDIVETNTLPSVTAPTNVDGVVGVPNSVPLVAVDGDEPAQALMLDATTTCAFDVAIDGSNLAWTCDRPGTCAAEVMVDDGQATSSASVTIVCSAVPLAFTSPTSATTVEHAAFVFTPACNGTISLVADTCAGAFANGAFAFTPSEAQGGTTCALTLSCSDTFTSIEQIVTITIAEIDAAPVIGNLPATVSFDQLATGTFAIAVSDSDLPAQAITTSLVSTTCPFTITVADDVSFVCSAPVTCTAELGASDGANSVSGTLTIACGNAAPTFTSSAPTAATEHQPLTYRPSCSDPSDDVVIALVSNTCGGTYSAGAFTFTPDEARGATTCALVLSCGDGQTTIEQRTTITIAEQNAVPGFTGTPYTVTTSLGAAGTFTARASDSDLPVQTLTYSRVATTCNFPVAVATSGAISYTCSTAGACNVTLGVSDGSASAQATLAVTCSDTPPTFGSTAPTTAVENTAYSYSPSCGDAETTTTISATDTCGGTFANGTFTFTPSEAQGGTTCALTLSCSDGATTVTQAVTITIAELSDTPTFSTNAPTTASEHVAYSYTPACVDSDGATTLALTTTTCGGAAAAGTYTFTPSEAQGGTTCAFTYTCSQGGESITQDVTVQIGEVNVAPNFTTIPMSLTTRRTTSTTSTLAASDTDVPAQPLTFSRVSTTCGFTINVTSAGAVSFTCPNAVSECGVIVGVSDGTTTTQADIAVACTNAAPAFTSTLPTTASEATQFSYTPTCSDDEATTITVGTHTCGGSFMAGTYRFTPSETQGGTTCSLTFDCSDGLTSVSQSQTITIAETNTRPLFTGTPYVASAHWARSGELTLTATDADRPNQSLTFALVSETCGFLVAVSSAGRLSLTCAAAVETCSAFVSVSDGSLPNYAEVTLNCTNSTPTISAVAISPAQPTTVGQPLTCGYTFTDAENDTDRSTITWLVDGSQAGTGATFSSYTYDSNITCRVNPFDGLAANAPVTATALGPASVSAMDGGDYFGCALRLGTVSCWGSNSHGQLGPAVSNAFSTTTAAVSGLGTGVSALATGYTHACVIDGGAVKCWGAGAFLGDGVGTNSPTPKQVVGLTSDVTYLDAGPIHTCAIKDGALYCWGSATNGRLGNGATSGNQLTPVLVAGFETGTTAVACGGSNTCAVKNGAATCWGTNQFGQLGNGTSTETTERVAVSGLDSGVTAIVMGTGHACVVHDGAVKCWGSNSRTQVGPTASRIPILQPGLGSGVTQLVAGGNFNCVIQAGALKCWGDNTGRQLGQPANTVIAGTAAVVIGYESNVRVVGVGTSHSCAARAGVVGCWGSNYGGQLGAPGPSAVPITVNASGLSAPAAGSDYTCAIQSGAAKCWGINGGILGNGSTADSWTSVQVTGLTTDVTHIAARRYHSCAIRAGALWCWGASGIPLGNGAAGGLVPVAVSGLTSGVTAVGVGSGATCALHNGGVKCWGNNGEGQLGTGDTVASTTPVSVSGLTSGVTALAVGADHACAIQAGALKCWGWNGNGQLGNGGGLSSALPVQVTGLTSDVTAVAAGDAHTCALRNGAVSCWGNNGEGRLGDGTTTNRSTPVPALGLTSGVSAIDVGGAFSFAIKDGALMAWGRNRNGQLGDGTTTDQSTPVATVLTSAVTSVDGGDTHTCVMHSGVVKCWGSNTRGQILSNPGRESITPVTLVF